jgi:hypothetical protein
VPPGWSLRLTGRQMHPCLTVASQTSMLADYGEVRESGLTGVTRNHVCPCGTEGSNPSLSATQSEIFRHSRRIA